MAVAAETGSDVEERSGAGWRILPSSLACAGTGGSRGPGECEALAASPGSRKAQL